MPRKRTRKLKHKWAKSYWSQSATLTYSQQKSCIIQPLLHTHFLQKPFFLKLRDLLTFAQLRRTKPKDCSLDIAQSYGPRQKLWDKRQIEITVIAIILSPVLRTSFSSFTTKSKCDIELATGELIISLKSIHWF